MFNGYSPLNNSYVAERSILGVGMTTDVNNEKSSSDYKSRLSEIFSRSSPTYDQIGPKFFSHFGNKLVQFADLQKGSSVLDIACGKGAVLFPASSAVSNSGSVVGIDISKGMVEQTHQEILLRNIKNTHVLVMDAERLDFPNSEFDYVLCGLCLFFFPKLEGALKEFYRVLKPGGNLIASTFKKQKDDERTKEWDLLYESFKDRIAEVPNVETSNLNNAREIKQRFQEAGFMEPEIIIRRKTFYYMDEDDWWETMWSHGYRSYLERIPSKHISEFRTRAFDIVRKKETKRGIPIKWELLISKAQKSPDYSAT
jgi:ubiquinone/menaquinone biosynthesis C-methylase UbiE